MIRVGLDRRWRVDLLAEFGLPMSAEAAWRSLRDFHRFTCMDLLRISADSEHSFRRNLNTHFGRI